jgi:hypothetical protein
MNLVDLLSLEERIFESCRSTPQAGMRVLEFLTGHEIEFTLFGRCPGEYVTA